MYTLIHLVECMDIHSSLHNTYRQILSNNAAGSESKSMMGFHKRVEMQDGRDKTMREFVARISLSLSLFFMVSQRLEVLEWLQQYITLFSFIRDLCGPRNKSKKILGNSKFLLCKWRSKLKVYEFLCSINQQLSLHGACTCLSTCVQELRAYQLRVSVLKCLETPS